jgi:hypothetical protein
MRYNIVLLFFFLVSTSFAQTDSSDGGGGIVYGSDHAFIISAPKGWVLDNSSGVSQGLYAVFYPKGGSWEQSPAVMYANTASRKSKDNETVVKLIEYDSNQFKSNHPEVKIGDLPSLRTKNEKSAIVKTFAYTQYEAVAYIEEETIIAMIVLTTRTEEQFNNALPAFRELVSSYLFITKDVHLPNK